MKFDISTTISIDSEINPDHLVQILKPENSTPDSTNIESMIDNNQVVTTIRGNMKISTLLRSIDDIIQTAILSTEVSSSVEEKQDRQK